MESTSRIRKKCYYSAVVFARVGVFAVFVGVALSFFTTGCAEVLELLVRGNHDRGLIDAPPDSSQNTGGSTSATNSASKVTEVYDLNGVFLGELVEWITPKTGDPYMLVLGKTGYLLSFTTSGNSSLVGFSMHSNNSVNGPFFKIAQNGQPPPKAKRVYFNRRYIGFYVAQDVDASGNVLPNDGITHMKYTVDSDGKTRDNTAGPVPMPLGAPIKKHLGEYAFNLVSISWKEIGLPPILAGPFELVEK